MNFFVKITGNKTLRQFFEEEYYASHKIGPNRGMFTVEETLIPSGQHYIIIVRGKQYSKNENQHMALVSESQ